ncbi:MAG: hypothetical protein WAZ18_05080 [Alphaproteobacteria bacterium]
MGNIDLKTVVISLLIISSLMLGYIVGQKKETKDCSDLGKFFVKDEYIVNTQTGCAYGLSGKAFYSTSTVLGKKCSLYDGVDDSTDTNSDSNEISRAAEEYQQDYESTRGRY